MYWDFSGKLVSVSTNMNFNTQFKNRWRLNGSFTRTGENISTSMLRGGPSFVNPGEFDINLNLNSDQSKKFIFNIGYYLGTGDDKSSRYKEYWGGLNIRPMNSLSISISPEYGVQNKRLQYITTAISNNDPKYLFGELDMKTLSLTLRINYTINPELTIEYYGQPFVSAGKYSNFNRITDPKAEKFGNRYRLFTADEINLNGENNAYMIDENLDGKIDYTFGNPDFNFRQFRSNLVVRWEYLPGSTLYLVWSQGRTSSDINGLFSYGNDVKDLFKIIPHNIFLIKFSYWFSL
jgi:hypothetical protein